MESEVRIAGRRWRISGDDKYASSLGEVFEPDLVALLAVMCDEGAQIVDVGANIGCTALALSQIAGDSGRVVAIEPVPRTFSHLSRNVRDVPNIFLQNFALGGISGTVTMQGNDNNLSGAFVADQFKTNHSGHFTVNVPVRTIDEAIQSFGIDRLDFIKIDVEGFELDVLEGATESLRRYKPRVVLEMNHFCLNQFRRITIPEFRERLLAIFPHAYAVDGAEYLDFTDEKEAYTISYRHLVNMRYSNIAAGFDKTDLLKRLTSLDRARHVLHAASVENARMQDALQEKISIIEQQLLIERGTAHQEISALREKLDSATALVHEVESQKQALLSSSSWRLTKPIRILKRLVSNS